jgi:hypothetical protein
MGLIKKGSRLITIDEITYRWRYPPKPNYNHQDGYPCVAIAIQKLNSNGSILAVYFDRYHLSGAYDSRSGLRKPVIPAEIAFCIREAIRLSWQSDTSGKQFLLDAKEECFTTY